MRSAIASRALPEFKLSLCHALRTRRLLERFDSVLTGRGGGRSTPVAETSEDEDEEAVCFLSVRTLEERNAQGFSSENAHLIVID